MHATFIILYMAASALEDSLANYFCTIILLLIKIILNLTCYSSENVLLVHELEVDVVVTSSTYANSSRQ